VSETIKLYAIKKPDGTYWKTPKGKSTWNGAGHAKNSWNAHNYYKREYTTSLGNTHYTWANQSWKEHAEPEGWTVVKIKEFKLVEDNE